MMTHKEKDIQALENNPALFCNLWNPLIYAVLGTDAGKRVICSDLERFTKNAITAIKKTEADRKAALRIAGAFQKMATSYSRWPQKHELNIRAKYFQAVIEGKKKAELRANDRDFKMGDYLVLKEWSPRIKRRYTGREVTVFITDITEVDFTAPGFVMLSFI